MLNAKTPASITPHAAKYNADAWKDYSTEELEWWVFLLTKRAGHRSDEAKKAKDLADAANYAAMLASALAEAGPVCNCGALKDPGSCGHSSSCPRVGMD